MSARGKWVYVVQYGAAGEYRSNTLWQALRDVAALLRSGHSVVVHRVPRI